MPFLYLGVFLDILLHTIYYTQSWALSIFYNFFDTILYYTKYTSVHLYMHLESF